MFKEQQPGATVLQGVKVDDEAVVTTGLVFIKDIPSI